MSVRGHNEHYNVTCKGVCSQVTPLTSLKFGELVAKAGFPPGVINVISGSGIYYVS